MRRGILASRDELAGLSERIPRKPFDTIYEVLRRRCSLILETQPVGEAQWRGLWQQGFAAAALQAARTTQGRIFDLLIAHHIDRNPAYRDRAIEELKGLIGWSTWVDPAHGDLPADLCTAEAAVAAAVGLDWLWEDLREPDRLRVLQALRHKAIDPYRQGVRQGAFWYDCYHSWNAVVNGGCGLAALALQDEEPPAQEALRLAMDGLQHFLAGLGREGGWDEGTGAWGHALRSVLLLGEACHRALADRRLLHARGMDATGLFPIYFAPNGHPAGFGSSAVPAFGTLYLLVKHHGLRDMTWWLDTYAFRGIPDATNWESIGLALLFRPPDAECPNVPELTPLKVFHEIGWAAMADAWPRPAFYVAVKSGDLAAHLSRPEMNSIQLQVNGEMLLASAGDDPEVRKRTPGEGAMALQTPLHNTLTVAQNDHAMDAQGSILEAETDRLYRWVACDAGAACGEAVRFIRHLVMVLDPTGQHGRMLLVLDDLDLPTPERVDLFWHTPGTVTLAPGESSGVIQGARGALHFALGGSVPVKADAGSSEYPAPPGRGLLHVQAGAVGKIALLSVFSHTPLTGKIELKRTGTGDVRLKVLDVDLHFKNRRKHLLLEKVVMK